MLFQQKGFFNIQTQRFSKTGSFYKIKKKITVLIFPSSMLYSTETFTFREGMSTFLTCSKINLILLTVNSTKIT